MEKLLKQILELERKLPTSKYPHLLIKKIKFLKQKQKNLYWFEYLAK
jgi:hypothetical protein